MDSWKTRIENGLSHLKRRTLGDDHRGDAAVLVAILPGGTEPSFLLTKRSQTVATHKGHISFPGGMREPRDSTLESTALRETHEELGIEPALVTLLGSLHEYMAATGHRVSPFVGWLAPEPTVQLDTAEVEYVIRVPFPFFLEQAPRVEEVYWRKRMHNLYYYEFEGDTVWGLTAAIIRDFLHVLEPSNPLLAPPPAND